MGTHGAHRSGRTKRPDEGIVSQSCLLYLLAMAFLAVVVILVIL